MRRIVLVGALVILLFTSIPLAATWYVKDDGTGDVPTIQAAVDTVAPGDTVMLASGTYTGAGNFNVVVPEKPFLLTSETGDPGDCIVDCQGHLGSDRRGFHFEARGDPPVVRGITIRNGNTSGNAGAVLSEGALTMRDCVFESNTTGASAINGGGAIGFYNAGGSVCVLKSCVFISNEALGTGRGGALTIEGDGYYEAYVDSCFFYDNQAHYGGAIYCFMHEVYAYISNSVFVQNSAQLGGAMMVDNVNAAYVSNCTFHANDAEEGSGIWSSVGYYFSIPTARVSNCIIAYGTGGGGYYQPHFDPADHSFQCNNLYGNEGGDYPDSLTIRLGVDGNFSACPGFCDAAMEPYDLNLCDSSPCLPGNHPDGAGCGLIGALGEGCICDPTRTEPASWGSIKALFR